MTQHSMQIEMDGLITVLAENLYADPNVFIREILQNAHDAIAKRLASNLESKDTFLPEIRVQIDDESNALIFTDNGAGLTRDEIHRYLSTIGGSDKRTLKIQADNMQDADAHVIREMIGQFGIGMLSSFIVSSKVEVLTRSKNNPALLWRSFGSTEYTLEKADKESTGSRVTLYLKHGEIRYLDIDFLRQNIKKYADFIGIPIYINNEQAPCNRVNAPWHLTGLSKEDMYVEHASHWKARFPDELPLKLMPFDLTFKYNNEDGVKKQGKVSGTLAITSKQLPGIDAYGEADLFISGMFIGSNMQSLLPAWASFIHGVIESPSLTPNAARDNVMPNNALKAMRDILGEEILAWLIHMAGKEKKIFMNIARFHSFQLLAMSLNPKGRKLFLAIANLIPFDSNRGLTNMKDYFCSAEKNGKQKNVYYLTRADASTQGDMIAEARNLQVIHATTVLLEEFLCLYQKLQLSPINLKRIDSKVHGQFENITCSEAAAYKLLKLFCEQLIPVQCIISRFNPNDVPLLLIESEKSKAYQDIENLQKHAKASNEMHQIMERFLTEKGEKPALHLNINNTLINKLNDRASTSKYIVEQVILTMYNHALLLYARRIRSAQVKDSFKQSNYTAEMLLDSAEHIQQQDEMIEQLLAQIETLGGDVQYQVLKKQWA